MIIQHACENWENFIPKKVKTLILGSFNPSNFGNNVYYYYGRRRNYFWKAIGDILFNNQFHFFINGDLNTQLAFQIMEEHQFCFFDLITNIVLIGNNAEHETNFCEEKIFTGFSDTVLFTNNTNYQNNNINIQRNYNNYIITFINEYLPKKIFHTLGNTTIDQNFHSNIQDLNQFLNQLSNICNQTNSQIDPKSISPSQTNINRNGNYEELKFWLNQNLFL